MKSRWLESSRRDSRQKRRPLSLGLREPPTMLPKCRPLKKKRPRRPFSPSRSTTRSSRSWLDRLRRSTPSLSSRGWMPSLRRPSYPPKEQLSRQLIWRPIRARWKRYGQTLTRKPGSRKKSTSKRSKSRLVWRKKRSPATLSRGKRLKSRLRFRLRREPRTMPLIWSPTEKRWRN